MMRLSLDLRQRCECSQKSKFLLHLLCSSTLTSTLSNNYETKMLIFYVLSNLLMAAMIVAYRERIEHGAEHSYRT